MRGLTLDGVGVITYRDDLPEPKVERPSDAVVTVSAAGLCGSDLHPYHGRERVRWGVIPGHEVVGEIAEVGSEVPGYQPGDRVLVPFTTSCGSCGQCRGRLSSRCVSGELFGYGDPDRSSTPALPGGQAEQVRVPQAASTLVRVPDQVSNLEALLLSDNFPTGWYAAERAGIVPGRAVAVVGLGSVGLCTVVAARALGADPVVAIDPLPDRQGCAEQLGAQALLGEAAISDSFASVVEAAGTPEAQQMALRLLRPGGTLSIVSVPTAQTFSFTPVEAYDRNLTIRTGRAPVRSILDRLLGLLGDGQLTAACEAVFTHPRVPLEQGPETYRRFAAREPGFIKAAFVP